MLLMGVQAFKKPVDMALSKISFPICSLVVVFFLFVAYNKKFDVPVNLTLKTLLMPV